MATGPWDPMAAVAASRGLLRASDAEREQVIDALKTAFAQGLISRDELGARAGQALASPTCAELTAVTAGLTASRPPPPPAGRTPTGLTRRPSPRGRARSSWRPPWPPRFLTFYGGFIILFLVACIGAVVSAAPVRPPRPGPLPSAGRR